MKYALISTVFTLILAPMPAMAKTISGKTADGCSYQIVNGKYITNCPAKNLGSSDSVSNTASAPTASPTITSYGAVPVRANNNALRPSVESVTYTNTVSPQVNQAPTMIVPISTPDQGRMVPQESYAERKIERQDKFLNSTYAGASLGSANINSNGGGSSLGFGLQTGTNIDEFFGVEISYSYSKHDTFLNLQNRGATNPFPNSQLSNNGFATSASDSTLKTHLITADVLAHLTDTDKRLRPYLGLGLGFQSSKLEENSSVPLAMNPGASNVAGSLSQSSFGISTSGGTKFRITDSIQFAAALKYFFPVFRNSAKFDQSPGLAPASVSADGTTTDSTSVGSKLDSGDSRMTGSAQYQISGGLQYVF